MSNWKWNGWHYMNMDEYLAVQVIKEDWKEFGGGWIVKANQKGHDNEGILFSAPTEQECLSWMHDFMDDRLFKRKPLKKRNIKFDR